MSKKEIAIAFLKAAASGDVRNAYDNYVAADFIHHNQYFKGDRKSLMLAMEEASKVSPNKSFEVKHCYEDGDVVITHSLVEKTEMKIAVVHIVKFKNDKIIELWDLGQQINKDSPNENGMF
jgi:predicted SnoaL-like aldol condensation-catalyzing enzyme